MKRTLLLLLVLFSINIVFAQHEWVLKKWMQVYGDTVNQQLGYQVSYLGKKGDTTIVSVSEATIWDGEHYRVKLYYLKTQADTIPRYQYTGRDCTTGDFNGDGIQDLVVNGNPTRIYLAHEEGVFDTIPFFRKYQEPDGYSFGTRVAVGKINGDKYDDLLVADYGYPNGDFYGRVYLFLGGTLMDTTEYIVLNGAHENNIFGQNVASGDLNEDGFDDIIVKGVDASKSGPNGTILTDYIKIFLGGNTIDTTAWIYIIGSDDHGGPLGLACFDVNGDSVKDLLWSNYSVTNSMRAIQIHLSHDNKIDSLPTLLLLDNWAHNVTNAGDMNGDGYNDILISGDSNDQSGDSYVFTFSCGPKMDTNFDAGFGMLGTCDLGRLGSITGIGDINEDGYDDVLIGAPGYKWDSDQGSWTILLGSSKIPVTSVKQTNATLPGNFSLLQNYPNPFNPTTTIEYTLKNSGNVTLTVYNILGGEVKILVKEYQSYGSYKAEFNAEGLSSGVYYYTLTADGEEATKSMVLLK